MEYLPWIVLAIAVLFYMGSFEHFSRFEDTSQRKRSDKLVNSSFSQTTNHSIPQKEFDAPVSGIPTQFRVNIWDAYL
jgi:hypothetical protein